MDWWSIPSMVFVMRRVLGQPTGAWARPKVAAGPPCSAHLLVALRQSALWGSR